MVRPLIAVRINHDYDTKLLEKLAVQAVKPFGDIFEFVGVHSEIETIEFDPPIGPDGLPTWVIGLMERRLEFYHPDTDILAVMSHPIMTLNKDEFSPGQGHGRVAFLSTCHNYLNPNNRRFIEYGSKVAAHELGHLEPFVLDHHDAETYTKNGGLCLMYVARYRNMRRFLEKVDMDFCKDCYRTIMRKREWSIYDKSYI